MKKICNIQGLDSVDIPYLSSHSQSVIYENAVHLLGFCFDGTASYRKGARLGPDAIREASDNLEDYSPYFDMDLADLNLVDLGNLPIDYDDWHRGNDHFANTVGQLDLSNAKSKIILLGGEHSVSYSPIKWNLNSYPDLLLVHLDAHADLRDGYLGNKFSHASVIRRSLDHFGSGHSLIQYGIRSGTRDEFSFMRENNTIIDSLENLLSRLEKESKDRPVYLTLDLDFFDPAYCPGTGTPETGGENFHSIIRIFKQLSSMNFIGADVVELAPSIDQTGASSCFAAKVVRECIFALSV